MLRKNGRRPSNHPCINRLVPVVLLGLAACNVAGPPLAGQEGLTWEVKRYYLDHATEENGICPRPEIRTITRTEVVEETDTSLVLRLRYRYVDTSGPEPIGPLPVLQPINCNNFASREFEFAKMTNGTLQVVGMRGEKRNVRNNFSTGDRGS